MPEGPEVRKHAIALAAILEKQKLLEVRSRMKDAKAWLLENPDELVGRRVLRVHAHGKHLLVRLEGDYFFHSHLMMWGRWQIFDSSPEESDRRERARLTTKNGCAILFSAPIFQIGQGDPYALIENLSTLGPDILPYKGKFDFQEFLRRLHLPENRARAIGAALLDQQICAGIGNYLRAEILFLCRIDPYKQVIELTEKELKCLCRTIPAQAKFAFETGGTTTLSDRERMENDAGLLYKGGGLWSAKHYVFRRTNLPCVVCGDKVRQLRQVTRIIQGEESEEEKTRILYFCPTCQNVKQEPKPRARKIAALKIQQEAQIEEELSS